MIEAASVAAVPVLKARGLHNIFLKLFVFTTVYEYNIINNDS